MKINKYKQLLPINLQLFAEGEDPEGDESGEEVKPITFASQAELDSWKDKELEKSKATMQAKWEQETQSRIEAAKSEAEELAKLSKNEREDRDRQQREESIVKREQELARKELKIEARTQLIAENLPVELVDILDLSSAENCQNSIKAIGVSFSTAVKAEVEKQLRSSVDNPLGGSSGISSTGNPFAKETLNLTEQGRLLREDPEKALALQKIANNK